MNDIALITGASRGIGRLAEDPAHAPHADFAGEQIPVVPEHDLVALRVGPNDVERLPRRYPEALPLPDGVVPVSGVPPKDAPGDIDDIPFARFRPN